MSISHLSILAADVDAGSLANLVLLVLSAGSLLVGGLIGVLPPRRVSGPTRIPPDSSSWPLVGVLFAGFGAYFFAASLVQVLWARSHPQANPTAIMESDSGMALLSTIPPIVALFAILLGDAAVRDTVRQDLGIGPRRLPRGILLGAVGTAIVVPPLFFLSQVLELIYRHIHYEHPTEHPLLRVLGEEHNAAARLAIILGACVIAPLWEELLFRAHLQTLLQRAMKWLLSRGVNTSANARQWRDEHPEPGPVLSYGVNPSPNAGPWANWLAIALTSALFMSMHPAWSWPIIFLLALCLGYAYERTGNLWVCITIHAMFNASMTAVFLLQSGR